VPSLSNAVILIQETALLLLNIDNDGGGTTARSNNYQRLNLPRTLSKTDIICAFGCDDRCNALPVSFMYVATLNKQIYRVNIGFPSTMRLVSITKQSEFGPPACLAICDKFLILPGELYDGEVLEIMEDEDGTLKAESKGTIPNWSGAIDFRVIDPEKEGQDMLMACCGQEPTGTIRLLRNGIHVNCISNSPAEYVGATGLWSCMMSNLLQKKVFVIISFPSSSRMLVYTEEGLEDMSDMPGFYSETQTIYASECVINATLCLLIQVTPKKVFLSQAFKDVREDLSFDLLPVSSWSLDEGQIAFATLVGNRLVIATSRIHTLRILSIQFFEE
jgi:splicing factor 3B subunit 3